MATRPPAPGGAPLLVAYSVGAALGMPPAVFAQARLGSAHAALGVTALAVAAGFGLRSVKVVDLQRRMFQTYCIRGTDGMAGTSFACWVLGLWHGVEKK